MLLALIYSKKKHKEKNMSATVMIVIIVALSFLFAAITSVINTYKQHLSLKEKVFLEEANAHNQQLTEQLIQLEQRIQVLEKIVTDEGYQVNKEINGL